MKASRQAKILEIIRRQDVETQQELTELLTGEGFDVRQPTVSRDIRELKLIKMQSSKGHLKYVSPPEAESVRKEVGESESLLRVFKEGFVSAQDASNILVVKTKSGMAMAVAACIDAMNIDGIVGSIAGDDTIMCAINTPDRAKEVGDRLNSL